ncbi:MAG: hypothetical protein AAF267_11200 [Deinococcota bacterium]
MLSTVQTFLKTKQPSYAQAVSSLRLIFVGMVAAQTSLALLVGVGLRAWQVFQQGASTNAPTLLGAILLLMALAQLPIGLVLAEVFGQQGGKQAALAATLVLAVIWSSVMWFAAFAWLIGSSQAVLLIFLLVFGLAYGVGIGMCNRYANIALRPPKDSQQDSQHKQVETASQTSSQDEIVPASTRKIIR